MNTFFFIMMTLIFLSYVGMIWYRFGVLTSISESYYKLPRKQQVLFTLFCWGFAIPAMILGDSVLMFLAGSAICFVGAASAFKMKQVYWVHMTGAMVGIFIVPNSIYFDFGNEWIAIITIMIDLILIANLLLWNIKTALWWIEIVTFIAICVTLGLKIF